MVFLAKLLRLRVLERVAKVRNADHSLPCVAFNTLPTQTIEQIRSALQVSGFVHGSSIWQIQCYWFMKIGKRLLFSVCRSLCIWTPVRIASVSCLPEGGPSYISSKAISQYRLAPFQAMSAWRRQKGDSHCLQSPSFWFHHSVSRYQSFWRMSFPYRLFIEWIFII